jgi:ribosomal protein L37AE/L43A
MELLAGMIELWRQPKLSDMAAKFYLDALKPYSDEEVKTAVAKCMDEAEYFPKPAEIVKILKAKKPQDVKDREIHDAEERRRYTCPSCHNYVHAIIDGKCWECYAGVPLSAGREPVVRPKSHRAGTGYMMQDMMTCQKCGKVGMCIKEPPHTGQWECRLCYSGLTKEQLTGKLRGLQQMMDKIMEKKKRVIEPPKPSTWRPSVYKERPQPKQKQEFNWGVE